MISITIKIERTKGMSSVVRFQNPHTTDNAIGVCLAHAINAVAPMLDVGEAGVLDAMIPVLNSDRVDVIRHDSTVELIQNILAADKANEQS